MKRIWRELPITDPLERRQAPLLLMLLPLMFVTALLRSAFFFQLDQTSIGASLSDVVNMIALVSPALGLLLLFRGRFSAATLLAALSMLMAVMLAISASGLRHSGMLPLVFALPIVLTGLVLGWRSLLFICTLSCASVIGIAVLEAQSSPLVGYTPSPEIPASMASVFVVVVVLLLSILAWFRRDFRHELDSRLQTEQTLRQSEARFATAFRASPAAMLIARLSDGCFLDVNASFERLFGYRRDEVIGQVEASTSIYTDPEQRAAIAGMLEPQGALRDQELILRTKSGDVHTFLCSAEILTLGGERCVLGSLVDITERKHAEQLVRESQERLAGIVDSAMDGIISLDATHRIIVFNAAAERMFGCPAAAALGQSLDRFIPRHFRDTHAHHIERFGQSGVTRRSMQSPGALRALRADGTEFPIEATISQVVTNGQTNAALD